MTAHELTHVVQQTGAKKLQQKPLVSRQSNKETLQAKISPATDAAIQCKQAPDSPQADPAFQAVVNKTKSVASKEKTHPPAKTKATEAQAAANPPANDVESKAQDKQVQEMNQQKPGQFNAAAFKAALNQKIAAVAPQTLEEADNFKDGNKIEWVKREVSSKVTDQKKQASDPIEEKTKEPPNPSGITPKPVTPLPPKQAGAKPGNVGATGAAPKAKDASEVSLQEGSKSLDQQMANANVTEEQLQKSNEPEFKSALGAKKTAQADAAKSPAAYRQQEQGILTKAQAQAQTTASTELQGMHGSKEQAVAKVLGNQTEAKGQDEQKRTEVANRIQGIYNNTKQKVEASLSQLDSQVNSQFDSGAAAAKSLFENYVDQRMKRYKDERYSGLDGPFKWGYDKMFGMPSEVNAFYQEGKQQYLASMDKTIDQIANLVASKLNAAKQEIAKGKQEIQKYVAGLEPSLRQVGQEAAQNIQGKFNELEQSVDNKESDLIDSLAQKYNDNVKALDARIDEMKAENRGLVDKALEAIGDTIKTINELKNMLMGVLRRAAGAIEKIIADPIGFLGNLVAGLKQGFLNFKDNISQHLKKGFMGFLTGAMASTGIQMPKSFDMKGIFGLVTEVLGMTYEAIRPKAVKRMGEKQVSALESNFEMFVILKNEGTGGLWKFIQGQIGDLKVMVIDTLQSFIIEKVIVSGITWILSLLNPASAFVRACKAIIDIIMFFIERASQIAELINAIIEAVTAIASGAIGGAAKAIENALSKSLPVVISFMASLLGLGGISDKVQEVIKRVRQPIEKAINWVIEQAVKFAKKIGNKLGFGKDKTKGEENLDEKSQSVKVPFTMDGAPHTLTLTSGLATKVEMASNNPGSLSAKIEAAIVKLGSQPSNKEAIDYLKRIKEKALSVESFLSKSTLSDVEKTQMKRKGVAIASDLTKYGDKYDVKDIDEVLNIYPPPEVGAYGQLGDGKALPDGTIREAHHAPPYELAKVYADVLALAAIDVEDDIGPETAEPLDQAAKNLTAAVPGGGASLPAILMHTKTHRQGRGVGLRVHGSEIRAELKRRLQRTHEYQLIVNANGKDVSVKGQEPTYRRQLENIAKQIAPAKASLREAMKTHAKEIIQASFEGAAAQTLDAVDIALTASVVDGPPDERAGKMRKLRELANTEWRQKLLGSLFT